MKKWFLRIGIFLAVVLVVYNIWAMMNRAKEKGTGWSKLPEFKTRFDYIEDGIDSGKGNVIGIQPYLTALNYSTAFNFEISLRFYFETCLNFFTAIPSRLQKIKPNMPSFT